LKLRARRRRRGQRPEQYRQWHDRQIIEPRSDPASETHYSRPLFVALPEHADPHGGAQAKPCSRADCCNGIALSRGVAIMLRWALFFLVISLIAALLGFTGIAAAAAGIAKVLFFLFIVITVILFALVIAAGRALRG
jgi:uncharacterized membrane protein YtjA (UPF0391 family)